MATKLREVFTLHGEGPYFFGHCENFAKVRLPVLLRALLLLQVRGDPCWRDLTCMNYFYQTQPNPNPAAYLAHQAPPAWHAFETFGNHMIGEAG